MESSAVLERAAGRDTPAGQLARAVGRINRYLRYRTRPHRQALGVTDSEFDLLRLLRRRPGIRVYEAAVELGVASNSVSTLIKQLGRAGLIDRASDPLDGRAACLRLTPQAESWLSEVGGVREAALARALASLDAPDRAVLEDAVPALQRLARALEGGPVASAEAGGSVAFGGTAGVGGAGGANGLGRASDGSEAGATAEHAEQAARGGAREASTAGGVRRAGGAREVGGR